MILEAHPSWNRGKDRGQSVHFVNVANMAHLSDDERSGNEPYLKHTA